MNNNLKIISGVAVCAVLVFLFMLIYAPLNRTSYYLDIVPNYRGYSELDNFVYKSLMALGVLDKDYI